MDVLLQANRLGQLEQVGLALAAQEAIRRAGHDVSAVGGVVCIVVAWTVRRGCDACELCAIGRCSATRLSTVYGHQQHKDAGLCVCVCGCVCLYLRHEWCGRVMLLISMFGGVSCVFWQVTLVDRGGGQLAGYCGVDL